MGVAADRGGRYALGRPAPCTSPGSRPCTGGTDDHLHRGSFHRGRGPASMLRHLTIGAFQA
eukprot:14863413-Alexandrium_andersonii.AAC.1